MNMKKLVLTLITTTAMTTALPSFADRSHSKDGYSGGGRNQEIVRDKGNRKSDRRFEHYLDKRQTRQLRRIEHGIDSGELTRKEARKLTRQQRQIARVEKEFSSDGHYSRKERRILEAKLDKAGGGIYRKKHNDRVRKQRYSAGLWKPSHGSHGNPEEDLHLGLIRYPGQGFPFWW